VTARIVLLAFAAAVFPTLIACVAVMISRPDPRRLLFAFYLGGLIVSVGAGIVVLSTFTSAESVAGSTKSGPAPGVSIGAGIVSMALGWLLASHTGRDILNRRRSRRPRRRTHDDGPSWAERHLDHANAAVAFVVGAAINLPGPFYLLALGDIAKGHYGTGAQLALILVFNGIMFLLVEVPLVGYLVRPRQTAELIGRFAVWLNANALRVLGWLITAVGIGLIVQGVAAAAR
jgi:hypothetical protein